MSSSDIIQVRRVHKKYVVKGDTLNVLDGISLTVKEGEFLSIVGSSGCGKSTFLRLVTGLELDYEGEILVDGLKVVGTSLERGLVFQEHRLFPWLTVEENVAIGLENSPLAPAEKKRSVTEHLELVGLGAFAKAYPHQLSGGMAQRAAIARGLVNRPRILLLDEPFGALDAVTRARLQDELQQIWQKENITMILVTHDLEEAVYLGDRVIVMEPRPGRIRREVSVDLRRPRDRRDPALQALADQVHGEIVDGRAN